MEDVKSIFSSKDTSKKSDSSIMDNLKKMYDDHFSSEEGEDYDGHAIYINYPNFKGSTANTIKVGNFDIGQKLGRMLGIENSHGVGHGETILIDKDGNASFIRYGRYNNGTGKVRSNGANGGNWGVYNLGIKKNKDESDADFVKRLMKTGGPGGLLADSKFGNFDITSIPGINTKKAFRLANEAANDENRSHYGLDFGGLFSTDPNRHFINTCASTNLDILNKSRSNLKALKDHFLGFNLPIDPRWYFNSKESNGKDQSSTASKISTALWDLIPFTTGDYGRQARSMGKTVMIDPDQVK